MENISPGFASGSVKHRPGGAKDDFTGSGSYASGKRPSNTPPWGTQKGIVDSNELNKLPKLKHMHLGKHLSKKVAHLLESRPHLWASFNKELKDTSYHSSKLRDSQSHGLHEMTMNSNEQGPEMDDQVTHTLASEPSESDSPEESLAHEKQEAHHKVHVPEQDTHVHSPSDIELVSYEP